MPLSDSVEYELPTLGAAHDATAWLSTRRADVLDTFAANVYGRAPLSGEVANLERLTRVEGQVSTDFRKVRSATTLNSAAYAATTVRLSAAIAVALLMPQMSCSPLALWSSSP